MTEYDINYACGQIENLTRNDILNQDYTKYLYILIDAARKYAKIKEALM